MEKFLESQNIPEHNRKLLKLAGVCSMADLVDLTEKDLVDIEQMVRKGGFKDQVNFKSSRMRVQYFGANLISTKDFSFRLFERKKLLKLPAAARLKVETRKLKKLIKLIWFYLFEWKVIKIIKLKFRAMENSSPRKSSTIPSKPESKIDNDDEESIGSDLDESEARLKVEKKKVKR